MDLSFPVSVNEGIRPDLCSLHYMSVEAVAQPVQHLGNEALMAKFDIKLAYRLVPVYLSDWHLLGVEWNRAIYVNGILPFGFHSVPKTFTAVADALQYILKKGACHSWTIISTI